MLDTLTIDDFRPLIGESFTLHAGDETLELRLQEAIPGQPFDDRRTPFSLSLQGPRDPVAPQQIWPLEHPRLGRLELFMVPVARNAQGTTYEIIFS